MNQERFANRRPLRLAAHGTSGTPDVADVDRSWFVAIDDLEVGCEVDWDGGWSVVYLRAASRGRLASFLAG